MKCWKWNEYVCLKIEYHFDWNWNYVFSWFSKKLANNSCTFFCTYANFYSFNLCITLHTDTWNTHLRIICEQFSMDTVWSCRIVIDSFGLIHLWCAPFSFRMPFSVKLHFLIGSTTPYTYKQRNASILSHANAFDGKMEISLNWSIF